MASIVGYLVFFTVITDDSFLLMKVVEPYEIYQYALMMEKGKKKGLNEFFKYFSNFYSFS